MAKTSSQLIPKLRAATAAIAGLALVACGTQTAPAGSPDAADASETSASASESASRSPDSPSSSQTPDKPSGSPATVGVPAHKFPSLHGGMVWVGMPTKVRKAMKSDIVNLFRAEAEYFGGTRARVEKVGGRILRKGDAAAFVVVARFDPKTTHQRLIRGLQLRYDALATDGGLVKIASVGDRTMVVSLAAEGDRLSGLADYWWVTGEEVIYIISAGKPGLGKKAAWRQATKDPLVTAFSKATVNDE